MKLIADSRKLEEEFIRLQNSYNKYYWLTAWASASSSVFEKLSENKEKIEKIVVGIHFYQTDPDFIEEFLDTKNVKYIMQPSGTFHPKIFLFYNSDNDWEAIIGSANFTKAAFSTNTEASLLINSKDNNSDKVLFDIKEKINKIWSESDEFDIEKLNNYRNTFKNNRSKIKSLSGKYGTTKKSQSKPIFLVPVANMTWDEFMDRVYSEKIEKVDSPINERLRLLTNAQSLFKKVNSFSELNDDERKFIAGVRNKYKADEKIDWELFGNMSGSGTYSGRINKNDELISKALDEIPLNGQITKSHYNRFIMYWSEAFEGNFIGTATRLLTMKRPDVFIPFDSANKKRLCKAFGIPQSSINYESYWDQIIERISDFNWCKNPEPKNEIEKKVSDYRVAFLDALYYDENTLQKNKNGASS